MSDVNITVRFFRDMQPAQYEKAGAEVTLGLVSTNPRYAADLLDHAQRVVLAALGKDYEFRPAGARPAVPTGEPMKVTASDVVPAGGTETPKAEGKLGEGTTATTPRRGRPPKTDKPVTKEALDDALAAAAGQPEPNAADIAGVDVEPKVGAKDLPEVTVEEMQTACSNAAMKLGSADKVRALYKVNYKVDRVAEIETEFRRPFLKDLATLVNKELAAKGATS